jgi:hypothetical protein
MESFSWVNKLNKTDPTGKSIGKHCDQNIISEDFRGIKGTGEILDLRVVE